MRCRASKAFLVAVLAACFGACGAARGLYNSVAHKTFAIATEGMLPNLKPGDRIVVDAAFYLSNPVRRFDVVLYVPPPEYVLKAEGVNKNSAYVHRVIGLGGETVEIKDGGVYVNGQLLEEPFETVPLDARQHFGPLKIPEDELFLLGDNRRNSWDSRYWPKPTLSGRYVPAKVIEVLK